MGNPKPNPANLKPFAKGFDERRNLKGVPRKPISQLLKDLGDSKRITFHIAITGNDGVVREQKGVIEGKGKQETINDLIATKLLSKAINGDLKAIAEVLDRTEGKAKQNIAIDGLVPGGKINVGYDDGEEGGE